MFAVVTYTATRFYDTLTAGDASPVNMDRMATVVWTEAEAGNERKITLFSD